MQIRACLNEFSSRVPPTAVAILLLLSGMFASPVSFAIEGGQIDDFESGGLLPL